MKLSDKIALWILAVLLVSLAAGFWRQPKKMKQQIEIEVDEIEDARGLGYSGQRKIAMNKNGDAFVAYRKKYEGKSEIFVAKISDKNNEWKISGTEKPISTVNRDADQRVPSIAIDKDDNIHVAWYGSDLMDQSNNRQIKYSKSEDGGATWSKWKNIAVVEGYADDDYWQEHPHVLTGTKGELFAVWEGKDVDNKHQQIKFSKSIDGGKTWNGWKNVRATRENTQSRPTLVQDKMGRLHLFAYSSFGNEQDSQQIVHLWSDDEGATWSDWEMLSDSSSDSRHVTAATDNEGNIHLAWRSQDSPVHSLILYRSLKDGAWSEIKTVAVSVNRYQFFPSIGIDEDEKVNVVWMESDKISDLPTENPANGKIFRAVLGLGEFSKPVEISTGDDNLYPHISETSKIDGVSAIYEAKDDNSKKFKLMFKLIR